MVQCIKGYYTQLILGDPGAVSGEGKKAKRASKKIGRRKVKKESRSPWDSSLNRPGACFSKGPKLFGRISGDIILYVSSKRRRLEARNFAVILIFIPFFNI